MLKSAASVLRNQLERLGRWWLGLELGAQIRLVLVTVIVVGTMVHQIVPLYHWYIEDAAISFAYARNLIHGEGLVAYPGGERLEGYSNPTWVALLALTQLVGLDPFTSTKFVEALLALLTLPPVWLAVREGTGRERNDLPLVALAFLAADTQFAVFGGAGLENGLLNLLIAVGIWRSMVELRTGGTPWSAVVWMLVALTRPEGILYAAVAGFCAMVFQLHDPRGAVRGIRSTVQWLVLFFVPWTAYQLVHYWYFAWALPNTYYAKLGDRDEPRLVWDRKAWMTARNYFHDVGQGFFLPVWLLGILGDGRIRTAIATAVFLLVGLTIQLSEGQRWLLPVVVGALWAAFWFGLRATEENPPRELMAAATVVALVLVGSAEGLRYFAAFVPNLVPTPDFAKVVPPYEFIGLGLVLPLIAYGARGWQLRVLTWLLCCAVIGYQVYVEWDWMQGYRWYATAAVPGAILFAFGADGFARLIEEMFGFLPQRLAVADASRWRTWTPLGVGVAIGLIALQLPANIYATVKLANAPDPSPEGILVRVHHVEGLRDRLHVDRRFVDLDVDMGAHLWWSDFEMMDIAGLVDLPLAHHKFERPFVQEYVFQERRPDYAHVHGQWASNSKIPSHPEWRKDYVEVPGYVVGKNTIHIGSYLRRDLMVQPTWPYQDDRQVALGDEVMVYGVTVPSAPAAGHQMYVEVGVADTKARKLAADDFRMVLFATDGAQVLASWDLPPGYDWLKPDKWSPTEIFVGKFDLTLPKTLQPGSYDLGLVVFDADGVPLAPTPDGSRGTGIRIGGEDVEPTLMAAGEVHFPGALKVLSADEAVAAADADRNAAIDQATALKCDDAEHSWWIAREHRPKAEDWVDRYRDQMETAFANCWARSADGADRDEQVRRLAKAREWDWWAPEYTARAGPLADQLYADGLKAREAKDWEAAYKLFSDAVNVDRSQSWARRYAEEARGFRLGIDPDSLEAKDIADAAAKQAAEDKRKAAAEERATHPPPPPRAKITPAPAAPVGDGQ